MIHIYSLCVFMKYFQRGFLPAANQKNNNEQFIVAVP